MPQDPEKPVLTPEQIEQRFLKPEGDFQESNNPNPDNPGDTFTPSPLWDYYKSKLPETERESFKLPEDVTKDNETELLDKHFEKIYSKAPVVDTLHPLAKEIQELSSKVDNFDALEFIKSKAGALDYGKRDDDSIVTEIYSKQVLKSEQNPNGLTAEEIAENVANMNVMDKRIMANKYREQMDAEIKTRYQPGQQKTIYNDSNMLNAYKQQVEEYVNKIFVPENQRGEKAHEIRTIAGVDIGESNFQNFKDEFQKMLLPNDEGVIEMAVKQQDDNYLFEFALYQRFKDVVKDAIVKAKNEGKLGALNQLPETPQNVGGGTTNKNQALSMEEMIERFSKPEGTY
jgi:hypothetical protein